MEETLVFFTVVLFGSTLPFHVSFRFMHRYKKDKERGKEGAVIAWRGLEPNKTTKKRGPLPLYENYV